MLRDWLVLEQTRLHDREADADRKRFDGRDVGARGRAPWRLYAPRIAEFSCERVPVFTAIHSRTGPH